MEFMRQWFPVRERWFFWPLLLHLSAWMVLGHVYETAVFQDASTRLAMGRGVYEAFSSWFATYGDGYYAYPPLYAYMLWASGELAELFGGHWWISQLLTKMWMLVADLLTVSLLYRLKPSAAKKYWTFWYIPVVGIGLVQPDLWVGLSILLAFYLAKHGRWLGTGLVLAAAIGMKVTPIAVLPFLGLHLMQTRSWTAGLKVAAGLAVGLALVWVPYALIFDDVERFGQVLLFHFERPVAGLNALAGLQLMVETGLTVGSLVGFHVPASRPLTEVTQRVVDVYPILTFLAFAGLAILARAQRWSLAQVFSLPMLAFMLFNKVVFEQYALHVLPLLLVSYPGAWTRLAGPYALYIFAAGTPWRFFPREYGVPSTPDALIPASWHAVFGPLVILGFAIGAAGAALIFTWQLSRLIRSLLHVRASSYSISHHTGLLDSLRNSLDRLFAHPELEKP